MAMQAELRRSRAALLCSTALVGVSCLVVPVAAQPAPNARPHGGQVVAGGAQIGQTDAATTVTQSTQRAAVDWRSFDVGAAHSVTFAQPGATAVILNRVTGPDPSAIAGQISANGQVIITNPSGVVFHRGAQVNAAGIVVSAPGITNQNFMDGRMVFDQAPKRDARVENHGTITVKQAGLAALVAPAVVNSGVINARMGRVVLGGAATHTLDLYGDGLVSLDVTSQVREAPRGVDGQPVAALVTNTGTVRADGGVVQLTAAAADGVVSTLVRAGGRIQANTTEGRTGRVEITGTGGSVIVEGRVAADGRTPGSTGGGVLLAADGVTSLAPSARVTASGQAGGGIVAVGTTLARARTLGAAPAGTSARTLMAAGARVSADAKGRGDGGRVTVLSTGDTRIAGTLTARGGRDGGNGGKVELSGAGRFSLTGTADTSAPRGGLGTVVLDPFNLDIVPDPGVNTVTPNPNGNPNLPAGVGGGQNTTDTVNRSTIEALDGNIRLQATNDITVRTPLTLGDRSLTLEAGNNLTIAAGSTIGTTGTSLTFTAAYAGVLGSNPAGALRVFGILNTGTGDITLSAGTGGIQLAESVTTGILRINTPGALTQIGGRVSADLLTGTSGSVSLPSIAADNLISEIGGRTPYAVTGATGDFELVNSTDLAITGLSVQAGRTVSLTQNSATANALSIFGPLSIAGGTLAIIAPAGIEVTATTPTPAPTPTPYLSLTTASLSNVVGGGGTLSLQSPAGGTGAAAGTVTLGRVGDARLNFGTSGNFGTLNLQASGPVSQNPPITVNRVTGLAGTFILPSDFNTVRELGGVTTTDTLEFHNGASFVVNGPLSAGGGAGDIFLSLIGGTAPTVTLAADVRGNIVAVRSITSLTNLDGQVLQTGGVVTGDRLTLISGSASFGGANALTNLGDTTLTQGLTLNNAQPLRVIGLVRTGEGALTLTAPTITQSSTSALTTPILNSTSTAATFDSATNQVGRVNVQAPGGTFAITNATPLGIGAVEAAGGQVQFTANQVSAGTNPVNVPGGLVRFLPLTPGRRIEVINGGAADLNSLSLSQGLLALLNTDTLALGGPGTSGPINFGNVGQAINLGGFASTLLLQTTGAVTQDAGATLAVPNLTGRSASLALGNANPIGSLGRASVVPGLVNGYATTGALTLASSGRLDVSNPVSSGGALSLSAASTLTVTPGALINAPSVALASTGGMVALSGGQLTTPGTLTLNAGAGVTQGTSVADATILDVGTLTGTAGGATALGYNGNEVRTLGAYNSTGGLALFSGVPLTVAGPVTDTVRASLRSGGDLTLAGTVAAPALALSTASLGAVTQTGGTLQVGSLSGQSGFTSVDLNQPGNAIATVGPFGAGAGGFTLVNGRDLAVTGQISSTARVSLQVAGNLQLASPVGADALALNVTGAITEPAGGSVQAQTLTGSATSANFGQAGNSVATLGAFSSTGGFTLANGRNLAVAGPVNDATSVNLDIAGDLALQGTVTTGSLVANAGSITQPGGTIRASSLAGSSTGSASFDQPGNAITTLGPFTSVGDFSVTDGTPISVTGAVSVGTGRTLSVTTDTTGFGTNGSLSAPGGTVRIAALSPAGLSINGGGAAPITATTLVLGTPTGGPVAILGDLDLPRVSVLDLQSAGALAQVGGAIRVGTLTGNGATATLNGPNRIGTLRGFTTTGAFSLANAEPLVVAGPVSASAATLNVTGDLQLRNNLSATTTMALTATGAITQEAGIVSAPLRLTLAANGAVRQTGGSISTGLLTGRAGSLNLPSRTNEIATVGPFTSAGGFLLYDNRSLTVAGTVDAQAVEMDVAGDLRLDGSVIGGSVTLTATDTITEGPNGLVAANTLTGSADRADLSGANRVAALGDFTTGTGFALNNQASLAVTGAIRDGRSVSLSTDGSMVLSGTITAPVTSLTAAGTIQQSGGAITTGTLSGSSGGTTALSSANTVATLGAFSSAGGFTLENRRSLDVTGPVQDNTRIRLNVTGDLRMQGILKTGTLSLSADGAITQPSGTIQAQQLTGAATTTSLDQPGNAITSLGQFDSVLDLSITDGRPLSVDGVVSAGVGRSINLTSDTVALGAGGALSAPGGTVRVAALTPVGLSITGDTGTVNAGTLVLGTPTGGPVAILGTLDLPGVSVLDLQSAGALTQSGGGIQVGTLTGSGASATLTGPNRIGTLGGFTASGLLTLRSVDNLSVVGPVNAGTLALNAPNVTLSGAVTAGTFDVTASGQVAQGAGTLSTGRLTGSSGQSVSLGEGGVANVTELASFTAGGNFVLQNAQPLTITGTLQAPQMSVSATGRLTLQGGTIATGPGSVLRVVGNAAEFVQAGTTVVAPLAGTTATLRLELTASGTMTLDNLQASSTDLTLSLGTGRATGALQAGSLLVVGSGGSANLTGSVAGQGGFAAAERSRISPQFDTGYLLNNCAIQSVSCVVRPVLPFSETALSSIIAPQRFLRPQAQGLDAITSPDSQRNDASRLPFLTFDRSTTRDRDDPSLLLPNISDRDY